MLLLGMDCGCEFGGHFFLFSVVLRGELILADFFSGAYIVLI